MNESCIRFNDPLPPTPPSLACQLGVTGCIRWRQLSAGTLTYTDNEPEYIDVAVVKKRQLHVVTDQMLAARRDMETQPGGRFSGLNLNLYPI